ncbi:hypothetical protein BC832DRAFT_51887 [Gaertneriomyces semiglobifer]|nr:hypothetical protein BC832DRAFT_51887 [Gaertneriomyces semiglobifer]
MEPSKKRPLSPGAGTSKQNSSSSHHYINDPSLSLPSLTHTASSERFNLPPLSSLTQFGGPVLTPPIHAHVRGSLANGSPSPQSSAKRLRLDDTVAAAERDRPSFGSPGAADVTAQQRRLSLHSSAELPDIAALAALTNRSGHKLPPPPRSMVPPVKANPQANNNRLPVPYSNPSSVPHMLPSMPAFNSNESLPKRSRNSPTPHGVVADPSSAGFYAVHDSWRDANAAAKLSAT